MLKRIQTFEKKPEKKVEEKIKNVPKKFNINDFLGKMNKESKERDKKYRRLSFRVEGYYSNNIIKERLAKLNAPQKEEKEETVEKNIPKKIDMRRHSEIMRMSLKPTNIPKEVKEIQKFNIEEFMKKMKEEETIKYHHEEFLKNPPKKISIEEYLTKLNNSNKKITIIRKKAPKKLDTKTFVDNMIINNNNIIKRHSVNIDEDSFENLNIRNRSSTVAGRLSTIEIENTKIEEEKKMIEEEKKKREEERIKREEERKKRAEERKKREEEKKRREEEEKKKRDEE